CGRPYCGGDASGRHQRLSHPVAEVVARALGEHPATDKSSGRAHATGEVTQPKADPAPLEFGLDHSPEKSVELAKPAILATGIPEIVGGIESRCHRFGSVYRETLVHQEFSQRRPAPRGPVVVVSALLGDQPLELAPAGW